MSRYFTRDKEGHYKLTKEPIHKKITCLNQNLNQMAETKYMKDNTDKLQGEIDNSTITVGRLPQCQ